MTCQTLVQSQPVQVNISKNTFKTKSASPKDTHALRSIVPPSALPEPSLHPKHSEIDREVITYLVQTWEWSSERTKKAFISWNLSEVITFILLTGKTSRVKLAYQLLLLSFLIDDHFNNYTHTQNSFTVSRL
ncbi:hypothetical protein QBC44DRAFT_370818 [Cladorrhinum sp. PSN332]|nr:hypothetical protein QBC44DRAFT_370818 [Cladorrhinum sp. PSN332]